MPTLHFTKNIQRHIACPDAKVDARTVREALDAFFAENPKARSYVLDDQGSVRRHMVIFVNGAQIKDPANLTDPVRPDDEIYVMQALSGG
jgi:molybdopterin synthase sulfur carrier subunit